MNVKISLAAARKNANLTQTEVAKTLQISKQTLVNWENGKIIPKPANIRALCDLYHFPLDAIFLPSKSSRQVREEQ